MHECKKIVSFFVDPLNNLDDQVLADIARANPAKTLVCADGVRRALWPAAAYSFLVVAAGSNQRAHAYVELEDGNVFQLVILTGAFPAEVMEFVPDGMPLIDGRITIDDFTVKKFLGPNAARKHVQKVQSRSDFPPKRIPRKIAAKAKRRH